MLHVRPGSDTSIIRLTRSGRAWSGVTAALLLAGALTGCLGNSGGASGTVQLKSKNTLENALIAGQGPVGLQTVVRTAINPSESIDLIGRGDGAIGKYCEAASGGRNTCRCVYDFVASTQTPQRIEVPPYYQEDNLLRCRFSDVPPSVEYVTIRLSVPVTENGATKLKNSNDILLYLNGYGVGSDLSTPSEFAQVSRYQCRDAIVVPHAFDSAVYDPIASEDLRYTYPLNYYTANFGRSLASFVTNRQAFATRGAGWICPTNPRAQQVGSDLRLYSEEPLAGSAVIDHSTPALKPAGVFDRSNFWLARRPTGIFRVPVHAYTAPNTNTVDNPGPGQSGPIGFGAAPLPESGASGRESCPAVSVPGYRWVKLWQFRATLDPRQIPMLRPQEINMLGRMVCGGAALSPSPGLFGGAAASQSYLSGSASSNGTPGTIVDWSGGVANLTFENQNQFTLASPDSNTSRFDFVLVASPATQLSPTEVVVHTSDFRDGPSARALQYTPYRFYSEQDCPAQVTDPRTQCGAAIAAGRTISYGYRSTGINVAGDPNPFNGGGRLPEFPVCALQRL